MTKQLPVPPAVDGIIPARPAKPRRSRALAITPPVDGPWIVEAPPVPTSLMAAIMQIASNPAMNIGTVDRLIAMQERSEDRQAERAFNASFVRLQGKLPRIKRDGTLEYPIDKNNPDGPKRAISKFAKWETIDAAIRPVLTAEGFGLSFKILPRSDGGLNVCAVLRHTGGYKEIGDPMPVPLDTSGGKNNLQAYGSSLSYGKKYAAFAALNIITEGEDTDGRTDVVRDTGELIGAAQLDVLRTLLAECSTDPTATAPNERHFIAKMGLDLRSLADARPEQFAGLRTALMTKRSNILAKRAATVAGKMLDAWDANKGETRT